MEIDTFQSSPLDQVDDASMALILELQREDVEELQRSSKGKHREDDVADVDLAIQLFEQGIQQMTTLFADRCMSRSLARAVTADSAILTDAVAREDAFTNDRLMAERIQQGGEFQCSNETPGDPMQDDLLIARLTALYQSSPSNERMATNEVEKESTISESSRWAAARTPTSETIRLECIPSSVIVVEHAGKLALVTSGTNLAWKLAQNKSWLVNCLKEPCLPSNRQNECSKPPNICAIVITAHMIAGARSVDLISARNAITFSRNTSSSADNAKSERAIGARATDYKDTD
ncbi:MAG: hypothetical protein Q9168_006853 [Polycauliona sp. 1 TL-2023]